MLLFLGISVEQCLWVTNFVLEAHNRSCRLSFSLLLLLFLIEVAAVGAGSFPGAFIKCLLLKCHSRFILPVDSIQRRTVSHSATGEYKPFQSTFSLRHTAGSSPAQQLENLEGTLLPVKITSTHTCTHAQNQLTYICQYITKSYSPACYNQKPCGLGMKLEV